MGRLRFHIGLVISKRLVEMMDGSIGAESELGQGSTFWVELPRYMQAPHEVRESPSPDTQTAEYTNTDAEVKTVLYVEDNPANLRRMKKIFARQPDMDLLDAPSGVLGLELAAAHLPDLILLDIQLPGMDGFEVLHRIQQGKDTQGIPVIAITANAMPRDIEKGLAAGFKEYLTKPLDVERLLEVLEQILGDTGPVFK